MLVGNVGNVPLKSPFPAFGYFGNYAATDEIT